jgi:hypothetical protein
MIGHTVYGQNDDLFSIPPPDYMKYAQQFHEAQNYGFDYCHLIDCIEYIASKSKIANCPVECQKPRFDHYQFAVTEFDRHPTHFILALVQC